MVDSDHILVVKRRVLWDIVPCSLGVDRRFIGADCLHPEGDE
jgi:hypothetical protein